MRVRVIVFLFALFLPALATAQDAFDLMQKGLRAYNAGRTKVAYDFFKQALAIEGDNYDALKNLAKLAEVQEKWDEANIYWAGLVYFHSGNMEQPEKDEIAKSVAKNSKSIYHRTSLTVRTTPREAQIQVNGVVVGKGEILLNLAPDRDYVVSTELKEYEPVEPRTVRLDDSEDKTVSFELKKIVYYGNLKIKLTPVDGVTVYVDTKPLKGFNPSLKLEEGRHLICFKKQGYDRWWRWVTVPRNADEDLEATLREQSLPDGSCESWPNED